MKKDKGKKNVSRVMNKKTKVGSGVRQYFSPIYI